MTPTEFRAARGALGLTAEALARVLQVQGSRTIYKWESGERGVPGPVSVLMGLMIELASVRRYLRV